MEDAILFAVSLAAIVSTVGMTLCSLFMLLLGLSRLVRRAWREAVEACACFACTTALAWCCLCIGKLSASSPVTVGQLIEIVRFYVMFEVFAFVLRVVPHGGRRS
jgi:predicted transporter